MSPLLTGLSPFTEEQIHALHSSLSTPALIAYLPRVERNLQHMQQLAEKSHTRLRPHTKTHKSFFFAGRQLAHGAAGITVAKLSEARGMFQQGISDLFIANQITQSLKLPDLRQLHEHSGILIGMDNRQHIELLRPVFKSSSKPLKVRIEVDSGLHRCGVTVGPALIDLAEHIKKESWLELEGIFTHAGQSYQARAPEEIRQIGEREGELMAEAKRLLADQGIDIQTVSVGSTPTVPYSSRNPLVNEIRPGNYIFYDGMQLTLGTAKAEQCALFVLSTVVSQPNDDRLVVDAGSKALSTEGFALSGNYGPVAFPDGRLVRLSEEHGVVQRKQKQKIAIGSPLLIVPNHACVAVNLFDFYHLVDSEMKVRKVAVDLRGNSR